MVRKRSKAVEPRLARSLTSLASNSKLDSQWIHLAARLKDRDLAKYVSKDDKLNTQQGIYETVTYVLDRLTDDLAAAKRFIDLSPIVLPQGNFLLPCVIATSKLETFADIAEVANRSSSKRIRYKVLSKQFNHRNLLVEYHHAIFYVGSRVPNADHISRVLSAKGAALL